MPRTPPVLLAVALAALLAGAPPAAAQPTGTTAFVGVHVVPMDSERVLTDQTVLVRGERIVAIGPADEVEVPDGAVRIDAAGRWLMPGLADMHVHVWREEHFTLFLANGVTTVRNMWGAPLHLGWQAEIEHGYRVAPSIYTVGPLMDGPGAFWPGSTILATPEEARAAVERVRADGYPAVKVYSLLAADVYAAIVETARELGLRVEGHVPESVGLEGALAAGQLSNEHLTGFSAATRAEDGPWDPAWDALPWAERTVKAAEIALRIEAGEISPDDVDDPEKIARLAQRIAASTLWNVPTLVVFQDRPEEEALAALAAPEMRYVDPATRQRWHPGRNQFTSGLTDDQIRASSRVWRDYRRRIVGALHAAGARLLLGTDTTNPLVVPGFAIHTELANLVACGLSPYAALRAGTAAAAEFLDQSHEWGTVTVGKRADLLLLERNPLDDVAHVAHPLGVMVRGRWLPAAQLHAQLEALAARYEAQEQFFAKLTAGDVAGAWALREAYAGRHEGTELLDEAAVNSAGYTLLWQGSTAAAIELLTLNAEAHPDSANAWDSLAEAYMRDGQDDKAIAYYTKALEIEPGNANAEQKLRELRGE